MQWHHQLLNWIRYPELKELPIQTNCATEFWNFRQEPAQRTEGTSNYLFTPELMLSCTASIFCQSDKKQQVWN